MYKPAALFWKGSNHGIATSCSGEFLHICNVQHERSQCLHIADSDGMRWSSSVMRSDTTALMSLYHAVCWSNKEVDEIEFIRCCGVSIPRKDTNAE